MGAYLGKITRTRPECSPSHANISTRADLVASIRGSHVKIPDLQSLFSHWPQHVHPEVDRLDEYAKKTLEWIFSAPEDEARLRKMKATEVALFAASWWAFAPFEILCVATTLSIWLFVWDDEIDSSEFSSLIEDFKSASEFRQETLKFLELSLSKERPEDISTLTNSRIIKCFKPVGDALAVHYNERQMDTFVKELTFFIDMCQEEHKFQMTADIPTTEQYIKRRMGSSAVRVCLAINEYTTGHTMPEEIMKSDSMQTIWHETNMIISTSNDIISIKKEIALSQADTLIPLLFLKSRSIQGAIDEAAAIVSKSIERLETAEDKILSHYSGSPKTQEMIRDHINACKLACTANLNWSLVSERYQLHVKTTANGIDVVL
ncbi:terpenoid synthase [Xylaria palmicola]|nr:terpenoid synthase [Xylaria palmicola]